MMAKNTDSELTYLTGFFKRVHCITFGAPPVSLLPLKTPKSVRNKKSVFFSFVNEGDPVARADKAVIRSLLKLYAAPAPSSPCAITNGAISTLRKRASRWGLTSAPVPVSPPSSSNASTSTIWRVPDADLSMGGRVIILRPKAMAREPDDIEAVTVEDELLRDVIFGDPVCHSMELYARRIEILATRAVTMGGFH